MRAQGQGCAVESSDLKGQFSGSLHGIYMERNAA